MKQTKNEMHESRSRFTCPGLLCALFFVLFGHLFWATTLYAQIDYAEYEIMDLNNGSQTIAAGTHDLPTSNGGNNVELLWDTLGADTDADWTWYNQGGIALATQNVPVATSTVIAFDPLTSSLYEGRTQILTIADANPSNDLYFVAERFNDNSPTADELIFDADQGPPDHPDLDDGAVAGITAPNASAILLDPIYQENRAQVEFNQASANPFIINLEGILRNIPTQITDPVSAEVFATVQADIVRIPGGSIAPIASPITTNTRPYPIIWPINPMAALPTFDGRTPGVFDFSFDFTAVQDGQYEIRLTATDIAGNSSPSIALATSTIITVILDRGNPDIIYTSPTDPFIIGQTPPLGPVYEDGLFTLVGQVNDIYSLPATVFTTVRENTNAWIQPLPSNSTVGPPGPGTFSEAMNLTSTGIGFIAANQPAPGDQEYWVVSTAALDAVGNGTPTSAILNVIYDLAPTEAPVFSFPPTSWATTASTINVSAFLDNERPAPDEPLEEHGSLLFELTVFPSATPTQRTTFTFAGIPSLTTHDSSLDDFSVDVIADPLGNIPDNFSGTQLLNLDAWNDGELTLELITIDQVGNRSPVTTATLTKGRVGPEITINPATSGPDDQYDVPGTPPMGQPPNQYGSDDLIFVLSLRSPERADNGILGGAAVGFPLPPNDFDPHPTPVVAPLEGNEFVLLSGTFSDVVTGVVRIQAWGANIPTTSSTVSPAVTSGNFGIVVDVRALPEGQPQVCNVRGVNELGVEGPVQSVIVIRDTVPARAPSITVPSSQPFFTAFDTMVVEGTAEPFNLIALITPVTTGGVSIPLLRTQNGLNGGVPIIPNPQSQYNSIPAGTVTTVRADALGRFRFDAVDLSRVSTSALTPTTFLLQAIDVYDNTDPVLSVTTLEIFRNGASGNALSVVVDPGSIYEQHIHPVAPTVPPTSGQFRNVQAVDIQVNFDTLIVEAPQLTVTQNQAPAVIAGMVSAVPSSALPTSSVVYQYPVFDRENDYDGPVLLDFINGLDIFGNVIAPLTINNAFFVDTVDPVLSTTAPTAFFPSNGESVVAITTIAVDVVDTPATVTTTASGLSMTVTTIELRGPLESNPDLTHILTTAVPQAPYEFAANPVTPITTEGTYRIVAHVFDNVGNEGVYFSTFVLDSTPIDTKLSVFNPPCEAIINELPLINGQQAITATVFDMDVDPTLSRVGLNAVTGTLIPLTQGNQGNNVLVGTLVTPWTTDGSNDGMYITSAEIFDRAGNPSPITTCWFIYDTTPPSLFEFEPSDLSCVNDPQRIAQVLIGDPPSPLATGVHTAGVDLDGSSIELILRAPFYPNQTKAGTKLVTQRKVRIVPEANFDILGLQILSENGGVRELASDGTEDGTYEISVLARDRAGNTTRVIGVFDYDTQHPRVMLDHFPEDSFFADTNFTITGQAFDMGPCGFDHLSIPVTAFPTSAIQIKIERADNAGQVITPVTAPFFDWTNADQVVPVAGVTNAIIVDRASWQFTRPIPNVAGPALLSVKAVDAAGNETVITRRITIKDGTLGAPVLKYPADNSAINEKVVMFQWDPVITAMRYDLELTRVTPTALTTTTTFAIPFPTSRFRIDLPEFTSRVPGGYPIEAGSIFQWRIRSIDVSENIGEYSVPFNFSVDPNLPAVLNVLFNGQSAAATTVVSAGVVEVQVDFNDETGMDISRSPLVTFQPRSRYYSPISVEQHSFTTSTWTGRFNLPLGGPEAEDINGPALLTVRDAFDRAGNALPETTAPFNINIGPWFDVRLFPNPVNPPELVFTAVGREYEDGPAVSVPFDEFTPNPDVQVRQQGKDQWETISVYPILATTPTSAAFRGAYTVDSSLIGYVDFTIEGQDTAGRRARRAFSINVADALAREGVLFWGAEPGSHVAIPPLALTADTLLYAMKERNGPPIPEAAQGPELIEVKSLGWFLPSNKPLVKEASIYASLPDGDLPCKPSQVGVYRWTGSKWEMCPTVASGKGLTGATKTLGAFALMADVVAPRLSDPYPASPEEEVSRRPELSVAVDELGAGVNPAQVSFVIDGTGYLGNYDESAKRVTYTPEKVLKAGKHEVSIVVADKAGNKSPVLSMDFLSAKAISVEQPVAFPSPARTHTTVRYRLSQAADNVRIRFYDVSGARVRTINTGPLGVGVQTTRWDLTNGRSRTVANGVYLYRVEATGADGTRGRATGKVAVLR